MKIELYQRGNGKFYDFPFLKKMLSYDKKLDCEVHSQSKYSLSINYYTSDQVLSRQTFSLGSLFYLLRNLGRSDDQTCKIQRVRIKMIFHRNRSKIRQF